MVARYIEAICGRAIYRGDNYVVARYIEATCGRAIYRGDMWSRDI